MIHKQPKTALKNESIIQVKKKNSVIFFKVDKIQLKRESVTQNSLVNQNSSGSHTKNNYPERYECQI